MNEIKSSLDKHNFNFKKRLGQNFLTDLNVINKIVNTADIDKETLVIEIGAGAGTLTGKIALLAKNVIAYEIDKSLQPILKEILHDHNNITIIHDNFLDRDLKKDIMGFEYKKLYIIGNLPYYITTPIITKIINEKMDVNKIIIMIQKEVAQRITAREGTKEYNSLTIFINYHYDVKKLFLVSRKVFVPEPNVDSMVIELSKKEKPFIVEDEELFFSIIRDAFRFKRKTLKNNLSGYNLSIITQILSKYSRDLTVRAEQLTIEQFVDIANAIKLSY
jgi:16S rRNA (adenine1518-N6/adenine1519-N6)-dimethyltransferase